MKEISVFIKFYCICRLHMKSLCSCIFSPAPFKSAYGVRIHHAAYICINSNKLDRLNGSVHSVCKLKMVQSVCAVCIFAAVFYMRISFLLPGIHNRNCIERNHRQNMVHSTIAFFPSIFVHFDLVLILKILSFDSIFAQVFFMFAVFFRSAFVVCFQKRWRCQRAPVRSQ